ncbi:carbonic anhydrase [Candidatus Leptofilum sp.]|uniref:carbonic anhydrase n=1 Tax=Candidatus Leptofilum sp. TaxID=3241576 RepID=UPI003B5BEFD9
MNATDALTRLQEGNGRFLAEIHNRDVSQERRMALATGQAPFAVILSCADSRVPPEIIFDQGLGDLFVIRVAGNVISPEVLGSVEFATQALGSRLVVVLGHTSCGAVQATLNEMANPTATLSPNLQALVDGIRPSITPLLNTNPPPEANTLLTLAVQSNIHQSVNQLRQNANRGQAESPANGLQIIGAEYDLATGKVAFFNSTDD